MTVLLATMLVGGTAGIALADEAVDETTNTPRVTFQERVAEILGIPVEDLQSAMTQARAEGEEQREAREAEREARRAEMKAQREAARAEKKEQREAARAEKKAQHEANKAGKIAQREAGKAEKVAHHEARKAEGQEQRAERQ